MNIRRLTTFILAAAALLPVLPVQAQNGSPFDVPTPGFGGGGSGTPDKSAAPAPGFGGGQSPGTADGIPPPQSPFSPPAVLARSSFTEILAAGAFRQHPRPMAWSGSSTPIAGSLPVSADILTLTLWNRDTVRGVVEARIATSRGIYYMFDGPGGAETIAADAITAVVSPSQVNQVSAVRAFAGQGSLVTRERAAKAKQAHLRAAAANQALRAYAHSYPGWTSGHGPSAGYTHSVYAPSVVRSGRPASGGGFAAGPGDSSGHDYARAVGAPDDPVLSTGWRSGHGARTEHVHDYYRHTKSGGLIHVHSYYRRPR